jgi:hypothetical protein
MMQSTDETDRSISTAASITSSTSTTSSAVREEEESISEEMIIDCCEEGDITKLRLWTSLGVNMLFSEAPLIRAVADGQVGVVRYLVEELGANVNQATATGLTPFIMAAGKGDVGMLRYLREELGAEVNHAMENGNTALMFAAQSGNVGALRYLGKELGADVNQPRPDGNTSLLISAILGSLDVVQCLVKELGADVNLANGDGLTPLIVGASKGYLGVVQWLLSEGGANLDEQGPTGHTLWHTLELEEADDAELTLLLQTMVILADAPPEFIAKLPQQQAEVCTRGRQLRTQLPAYLDQQRVSIVEHCPLLDVLQPLVAEYAAPTSEDIWTDGLCISVVE